MKRISIVCRNADKTGREIEVYSDAMGEKEFKYVLKEGTVYFMRVTFKVNNDIIYGLKLSNVVRKYSFKVLQIEEHLGTFAPTIDPHSVDLPEEVAPKGFFGRGKYSGKIILVDMTGIVHFQLVYTCTISSNWPK